MKIRDVIPLWRLERMRDRWAQPRRIALPTDTGGATAYDALVREIDALPSDWHGAGTCGPAPLRAIAHWAHSRRIRRSAETGTGKSTLLLSHVSADHTVFAIDDTGVSESFKNVRESPLLRRDAVTFVVGPTQQTLPRHEFGAEPLQLVLIDGPHGYPFPELEYYFFLPHLDEGALLILDDVHIPTIFRLFAFLREEAMFDLVGRVATTAFFRRNATPLFDPTGDGWWLQNFNRRRFPIREFDRDHAPDDSRISPGFRSLMGRFGHDPAPDQSGRRSGPSPRKEKP
jgi:predicted O-methyltransferase YrrM